MMESWGASHVGRVRLNNEDAFGSVPELAFFVVADGLGGAAAGERASNAAVAIIIKEVRAAGKRVNAGDVVNAVELANRRIRRAAQNDPSLHGMGTTVTAAIAREGRLEIVNAGDSRAYRLRQGSLNCLTQDHTWIRELASDNRVSPEQLRRHPYRHMLTKAVGSEPVVGAETTVADFGPNDILLLCSDGLHGVLEDEEIAAALATGESLKEKAEALIASTLDHGAPDNVTVLLVRHPGGEEGS